MSTPMNPLSAAGPKQHMMRLWHSQIGGVCKMGEEATLIAYVNGKEMAYNLILEIT